VWCPLLAAGDTIHLDTSFTRPGRGRSPITRQRLVLSCTNRVAMSTACGSVHLCVKMDHFDLKMTVPFLLHFGSVDFGVCGDTSWRYCPKHCPPSASFQIFSRGGGLNFGGIPHSGLFYGTGFWTNFAQHLKARSLHK